MELKKAFWNKRFLFSIVAALFLSLLSGFFQVRRYLIRTGFLNNPAYQNIADWGKDYHLSAETMADFWIGMDFSTWCGTAFFFLLPLLAVLPYGSSLHREYKSGYLNLVTQQISEALFCSKVFGVVSVRWRSNRSSYDHQRSFCRLYGADASAVRIGSDL